MDNEYNLESILKYIGKYNKQEVYWQSKIQWIIIDWILLYDLDL